MEQELTPCAQAIRKVIYDFITDKFKEKTESLSQTDSIFIAEQAKHLPAVWLEDTVKKVSGIQVVTHPFRMTNSQVNIKNASSFYCEPTTLPQHDFLASHVLKKRFSEDLTGNAAYFPSYTFLQFTYDDKSLLQYAVEEDIDFIAALHNDLSIAKKWASDIKNIFNPRTAQPASHVSGKQVLWLVGDDPYADEDYLLLAPLHASSLAYELHQKINFDRFTDESKEIRKATYENKKHDGVARDYRNLAVLKIGGSNSQNASLLNSRMGGLPYLLASLPPSWQPTKNRPPFNVQSVFSIFEKRRDTTFWTDDLKEFLASNPPANVQTCKKVERLVNGLLDELYIFAAVYQELPAGWSADEQCDLSLAQRYWLDPARAFQDVDFADAWLNSEWAVAVEQDFARWLNQQLGKKISQLGDIEYRRLAKAMHKDSHWRSFISDGLKRMQKDLVRSEN